MTERFRISVAIVILIILTLGIVYYVRSHKESSEPVTIEEQSAPAYDSTVRSSRSYRLEDNLSVPSERTVSEGE